MSKRIYSGKTPRFSRTWWLTNLHSLVWVVAVTLLVWIYADLEHIGVMDIEVRVKLTTGDADDLELLSANEITLQFKVRGNRKILAGFKRDLYTRGATLTYDLSEDNLAPGRHVIASRKILNRSAGIEQRGLAILTTSANEIIVFTDKLEERLVPVRFACVGGTLESVEVTPAQIPVKAGQNVWRQIDARDDNVVISTVQTNIESEPAGELKLRKNVQIVPTIATFGVRVAVSTIDVTYQIKERSSPPETIKVAVRTLAPQAWNEDSTWVNLTVKRRYPTEWLPEITVRGNRKDLDQLLNRKNEIDAYIRLTDDDKKPVSWLTREVSIRFPTGLQIELVGPAPTVQFKLIKRGETNP